MKTFSQLKKKYFLNIQIFENSLRTKKINFCEVC